MSQINNNNGQHVSRYEFDTAMKRIEALLDTQTQILVKLASAETDNKHRDSRIDDANAKADKALTAAADLRMTFARAAGALTVLGLLGNMILKKFGLA